jgi:4-amino-4-deoxy-L-arabinose transferase-like glycosyltransferase
MWRKIWFWPAVIAFAAWGAVLVALDPAGDHPGLFDGPGMTVDEPFNTVQGVDLADRMFRGDLDGFKRVDARLPDHPPLGRVWIGLCHEAAWLLWPPVDRTIVYSLTCARTASATAFAVLVFLVGWYAGGWYGRWGGAAASLALVLMPRVFGHAHLAALETMVNLTCTAALLFLAEKWGAVLQPAVPERAGATPFQRRAAVRALGIAAVGGVLFGLALLAKVQAVLLPIPIAVWALFRLRLRAIPLLIVWGLAGLVVLYALWPWLWSAPFDHLQAYLGRTTHRDKLYVWYFGEVLADRDVPWHYPWVMFLATVPIGLLALGFLGLCRIGSLVRFASREWLLVGTIGFALCIFSIPGVPVYDGERLFSFVFPLWAVLIGRGAEQARLWLAARWSPRIAMGSLIAFFAAQSFGLVAMAPCWLSYYNLVVGGLPGAAKVGLEVSYWGDGLTRSLLTEVAGTVPEGETIAVAPVLYEGQWQELLRQCPELRRKNLRLAPYGTTEAGMARYLLMFMRTEYLPEEFWKPIDSRRVITSTTRQGVPLALLLDRPQAPVNAD